MNNGQVPDADAIAYDGLGFFERAVNDRTILHIHPIAHTDGIDIATKDGVEPYTAIAPCLHITNDGCIGCDETVLSEAGHDTVDRKNDWHTFIFTEVLNCDRS
jgi:hypothetical protein